MPHSAEQWRRHEKLIVSFSGRSQPHNYICHFCCTCDEIIGEFLTGFDASFGLQSAGAPCQQRWRSIRPGMFLILCKSHCTELVNHNAALLSYCVQNLITCGTVGPARYKIVANFNLKNCGQCRRFLALLRDSSIGVAMASDVGKCSKEPEKIIVLYNVRSPN